VSCAQQCWIRQCSRQRNERLEAVAGSFAEAKALHWLIHASQPPLEEAVAFLQGRTGRSDAAGAETLAEALGRLPLALDHAAAYCKRTQMQFGDYAKKASSLIDAAPRGAGYPRSVAATFNLAITEAVAQCRAAEALMAYFAHSAIGQQVWCRFAPTATVGCRAGCLHSRRVSEGKRTYRRKREVMALSVHR
jgi:hypothetical protein